MSSLKKPKNRGWRKCSQCGCVILIPDEEKHSNVCKLMKTEDQFARNFYINDIDLKHSFMKNSRFFGMCIENTTDNLLGNLNLKGKGSDNFITLPLIVMRLCSISNGGLVMLTNSFGEQIIRTAAPNEHLRNDIGLFSQTLRNLNVKSGDFVMVEPYIGSNIPAKEIILTSKNESRMPVDVMEALKAHEMNRHLSIGSIISLRYKGNSLQFLVTNISGETVGFNESDIPKDNLPHLNSNYLKTSTPVKPHTNTMKIKKEFYRVVENTEIKVKNANFFCCESQSLSYNRLGGLKNEITLIQKLVDQSKNKNMSMGILVSGPQGVGKSALLRTVAAENKFHNFITPNKTLTEIQQAFQQAKERFPSIILIENIDEWCPKRSDKVNIYDIHLASALMIELNRIHSSENAVIIFATTKDLNDLDQTLRRPLYFDFEIELDIPSVQQKAEILLKTLETCNNTLNDSDIYELAKMAHGYTGSTLKHLVEKAKSEKLLATENLTAEVEIEFKDIKNIMKDIVPDALEGWDYQINQTHWPDLGGYEYEKQLLIQAIQWPFRNSEQFKKLGTCFSQGVLLYGPAGCGKSMLAETIATETGFNFISISSNDVSNKFVGKSEEAIQNLFKAAKRAAPCIIFFDKIESLASVRGGLGTGGRVESRILGQLLNAIEKVRSEMIFVIGATTRPQLVDKALLRPGRFDRKIHVPVPDSDARRKIFNVWLKKLDICTDIVDDELIRKTEKYAGTDIKKLCCLAMCKALQEQQPMLQKHLHLAVKDVSSSVADYEIEMCKKFQKTKENKI